MIETTNNCPTCGSAVEIHSGDEGTHCYLEITTEQAMRIKALISQRAYFAEEFMGACKEIQEFNKRIAADEVKIKALEAALERLGDAQPLSDPEPNPADGSPEFSAVLEVNTRIEYARQALQEKA